MKVNLINRKNEHFTNSELLLGVLAGVTLGLAAGILLAPRSGKDTRSQLAEAVNDRTESLSDQWNRTAAKAKETFDSAKAKAGVIVERAGDALNQAKHQADKLSAKAEDKA